MIFWTLVFITWFLILLIKGNPIANLSIKLTEMGIKASEGKSLTKDEENTSVKFVIAVFGMLILWIIQIIYLIKAIPIDTYKYPTFIMLAYLIFTIVTTKKPKSKVNLTTDEGKIEYRKVAYQSGKKTFTGVIKTLIFLAYYGYMFYLLAF